MQFQIKRDTLLKSLSIAHNIIERKNTIPILANVLLETKNKPKIKEFLDLIIASYEKFFVDLNSYNYKHFKEKADLMALN